MNNYYTYSKKKLTGFLIQFFKYFLKINENKN